MALDILTLKNRLNINKTTKEKSKLTRLPKITEMGIFRGEIGLLN